MKRAAVLTIILAFALSCALPPPRPAAPSPSKDVRGVYFEKKTYTPAPLPRFAETKDLLPSPIADEHPLWVETYWKAWELAFKNFHEPVPGSGFVSQFIDAAFNENIFLWDSCFMTMFCSYGHPFVPGIATLDNFYAKQFADGEIGREINRTTGVEYAPWINFEKKPLFSRWGWGLDDDKADRSVLYLGRRAPRPEPRLTLDALDHPIFAWAELEHFRLSGDRLRLAAVWEPLVRYYRALQKYLRQGNGLSITDWASMDNSPRNPSLNRGGTGIDISAEMVLFARDLAEIARLIGKYGDALAFRREADELSLLINRLMWDVEKKFYYDLTVDGVRAPVKTVASFWTLLAGVASKEQARALAAELKNPATFGRRHPVPTCAADESGYDARGGYWKGAVWAPTNTMVIRGLERYGFDELAREIALKHLDLVAEICKRTGTIWENYAPDAAEPGRHVTGELVKGDFVGWSGIGPILYLMEYGIGLKPDASTNTLEWRLSLHGRSGCKNYRFNNHSASLLARVPSDGTASVTVVSGGEFNLRIIFQGRTDTYKVKNGTNEFLLGTERRTP
jgi:hypothetical protein